MKLIDFIRRTITKVVKKNDERRSRRKRRNRTNVEKSLSDPNLSSVYTPLLVTASYTANYDNMKALLELGADVNAKGENGDGPLHMILRRDRHRHFNPNINHMDIIRGVELLLKYGVDVNVPNEYGITPLLLAITPCGSYMKPYELNFHGMYPNYDKNLILIRLLLDANADMNIPITARAFHYLNALYDANNNIIIEGDTILHYAIRIGSIELIQLLMEYNHPNLYSICNYNNETVLDIAKKLGLYHIVEIIKDKLRQQIHNYLLHCWVLLP